MTERLTKVRLTRLAKVFGPIRALSGVTMEVNAGDVVAVMGPNGAGKSTMLSLLSLNMRPSAGKILFDDEEASPGDLDIRGKIGLLSHQPLVYPELTARENLHFFGKLYGVDQLKDKVKSLENKLAIEGFAADRPTRALSRGQLQRVALARAMLSSPELLLLDEPAAGLDSASVSRIEVVVQEIVESEGMGIVVTHEPEVAARVATRAVMLRGGKVVHDAASPGNAALWRELYHDTVGGGN